jgi:diguanylate cyclase (GGDEF)-like protein
MSFGAIPLSAAGSLSVSVVALFFVAFQSFFAIRKRKFTSYAWAALFSFCTAVYAFFVFLQFIAPASDVQRIIDKVQFSCLLLMIHSMCGYSFAYLQISPALYHRITLPFHAGILVLVWVTNLIVGGPLVFRVFLWLSKPYVETDLGPLGVPFMAYLAASALFTVFLWLRQESRDQRANRLFGAGLMIFFILGVHDALASTGIIRTGQFLLEYGFLGFSTAILYLTAREHFFFENQAFMLERLNEELGIIARTDSLSKLANRYSFDRQYEKEWRILQRREREKIGSSHLSLLLCDIDFFKQYNDTYGHQAGDRCIVMVAEALATSARRPADFVSRYGGDEFAVLLPETRAEGTISLAETVLASIRDLRIEHTGSTVGPWVTLSMGIASICSQDHEAQDELFLRADRALYLAKTRGRDRVEVSPSVRAES